MNAFFFLSAADVASQWLELLHQDIKGRLSGNALFSTVRDRCEFFYCLLLLLLFFPHLFVSA